MIITKIIGGLGNQMFQYAIGRRIAHDNRQELALDIADFSWYRRPYLLDRFAIAGTSLSDADAKEWRAYEGKRSWRRWLEERKPMMSRRYRLEKESSYFTCDSDVLRIPPTDDLYLNGYWQNEKYFLPIRDILIREFTLKTEYAVTEHPAMRRVRETESIGIHFRRGDDQIGKTLGVPSLDYYKQAVELITRSIRQNLHIFVFSNEPAWTEKYFKSRHKTTFIKPADGVTDYQEFSILASCKHHIIANSTFSWWAAWLNSHQNRKIIAPRRWYFNDTSIPDSHSPIPKNWIKI